MTSCTGQGTTMGAGMPADNRARLILEAVQRDGYQTIEALASLCGVKPYTTRRDVIGLCDRGLLRRRHGGVELPPEGENLAYPARQVLNFQAKRRIAELVARNVPDSATLFFGIGTTPEQCALALTDHPGLRVMTNNLNVATALSRNPSCEITIAGGRVRNLDRDVVAAEAHDFFSRFAVDIGIYGVGAVAADGTLLDFGPDEVTMRRNMAQHCRQRFLVLDHSKFGRDATVRGGHITEATAVFTDKPVPPAIAAQLKDAGVRLVVWSDDASEPALNNGRG
ncbi:MAG: DeoR family transcriptional regulator [Ferrovibrio sp.]|nr:MAG: DeoR family transcriptional regulator [Ferrovibrio sp.]